MINENTKRQVQLTVESFFKLPRPLRRKMMRTYYKAHGVPRNFTFPKISAMREFKRLNFITFLDDLHKSMKRDLSAP